MYQVLYRKWRPKTFCDVCGQEQVTQTLKNQLKSGRISHAYLFTGSRGTGKTTCAKILAKAVNCLKPNDGDPCGECEICKGIESGRILDVTEMDAASNNHVEDIKSLIDEVNFSPSEAKYRVYIIDEVHMLTKSAFNALLKTLEEPPEHVIFILATTEIHELPATIISRCQRFDFNRIEPKHIADRLIYVAEQENTSLDYDAALLIAALSDGALRDALSILDRAINSDKHVTADLVRKIAGIADRDYLFSISEAVLEGNTDETLNIINKLHKSSMDCTRLCKELISHYRSLMLIKTMKNPRDLLILTDDEYNRGKELVKKTSLEKITYAINTLQLANEKNSKGADSRTELEMALVKLCSPQLDSDYDSLTARLADIELKLKNGISINNASSKNHENDSLHNKASGVESRYEAKEILPKEPLKIQRDDKKTQTVNKVESVSELKDGEKTLDSAESIPVKPLQKESSKLDFDEIKKNAVPFDRWKDVLAIMNRYSKAISSAFDGTTAYISGEYILIDSDNEIPFLLLKQSAQRDKMRSAIRQVTGSVYKLGPYNIKKKTESNDPLTDFVNKAKQQGLNIETD